MHLGYWRKLWQWSVLLIKLPPEWASNYSAMRNSPCTEMNSQLNHRSVQEVIWDLFTWKRRQIFPLWLFSRRKAPGVVELSCSGQTICQVSAGLCKSNILPQIFKKANFLNNCFLVYNRNIFFWDLSPWHLSSIHNGIYRQHLCPFSWAYCICNGCFLFPFISSGFSCKWHSLNRKRALGTDRIAESPLSFYTVHPHRHLQGSNLT